MTSVSLPTTGQRAVIIADGLSDGVLARVAGASADQLTLLPDLDEPSVPDSPEGLVTIEWASRLGIARVSGHVLANDGLPDPIEVELIGQPVILQRRGYARVPASFPVALAGDCLDWPVVARAEDVSGGGIHVSSPVLQLAVGDKLELTLQLARDCEVSAHARVSRSLSDGAYALGFEQITASDREKLIRLVADRMDEIAREEPG